jgi:sugar transferase (PEP-CTERM/EpsH1 system associated)
MKKILVISFRFPYPLTEGSRIRIYNICKILSQKYQVDLLVIDDKQVTNEQLQELQKICNRVITFTSGSMRFKINTLRGLLSMEPLQTYYYYFDSVQKWIDTHYKDYDLLFCFHIRMARYIRKIFSKPKIIDFIDATSINYREAIGKGRGVWNLIYPLESTRTLVYELKMLHEFDEFFITSPFDKAYLDKNSGHSNQNLVVLPMGVKDELFSRVNKFQGKEEDWIVFLGKMNYAPNVDAVIYFAREVFPLVKREANVKFFILGTNPVKEVLKLGMLKDVEVTGYVEDPYEYLEKAKVVVAPLRFAAGTQTKILEAMALRKAVVATSKATRGIEGGDGKHFVIADDKEEMARRILTLLDNEELRKKIGENGRKLIEEKYRWNIVGEKLLKEIEKVLNRRVEIYGKG